MTIENYLHLFKKYIKNEIDIEGIKLTPVDIGKFGKVIFDIESNGIPYSTESLTGEIEEYLIDFNSMLPSEFILKNNLNRIDFVGGSHLYLPKRYYTDLSNCLRNIKVLKEVNHDSEIKMFVKHDHVETELDGNGILFFNYVRVTRVEVDDVLVDTKDGIQTYISAMNDDRFYENQENYGDCDESMGSLPITVLDGRWMWYLINTQVVGY